MIRYIALLRGINISGKNKIAMSDLKHSFEELGFENVATYINSGNIIFSSESDDVNILSSKIKLMIKEKFQLDIPVLIMLQDKLKEILSNAPSWWGSDNKEIYDNLIFFIPPLTYEQFYAEIGNPNNEYEQVFNYKDVVFWSFSRKYYQKTNWWSKTASSAIAKQITIRTANTSKKIAYM